MQLQVPGPLRRQLAIHFNIRARRNRRIRIHDRSGRSACKATKCLASSTQRRRPPKQQHQHTSTHPTTDQATNQPTNRPSNQPNDQPTNQPTTNQPASQPPSNHRCEATPANYITSSTCVYAHVHTSMRGDAQSHHDVHTPASPLGVCLPECASCSCECQPRGLSEQQHHDMRHEPLFGRLTGCVCLCVYVC